MKFFKDENTNLSIENAELKYSIHEAEEYREKLSIAQNEIEMLKNSIQNMKDDQRKNQSELEALTKIQSRSEILIRSLEDERDKLQYEVDRYTKDGNAALFTNKAMITKNKAMHQLWQYEVRCINKINRADIKSEFIQTDLKGTENIIVMKRPDEAEVINKPSN